jgi:hypothetical protein
MQRLQKLKSIQFGHLDIKEDQIYFRFAKPPTLPERFCRSLRRLATIQRGVEINVQATSS